MKRLSPESYVSFALGSLSLCLVKIVAGYGYGAYDMGTLYGTQNVLVSGQDISTIPFVLPLLFAWLIKVSAQVFGNTFYAPFGAASFVYLMVLLIGNYLYCRAKNRGLIPGPLSLIIFTSAITINVLNPGHLWHSDLTSFLAALILWSVYCIGSAWGFSDRLLIGTLAAILLLCKQNLSPLYFFGYALFTVKSCFSEKSRPWLKSAGWVIFPILASIGLAFMIADYLGISLYDYSSTLKSIAAERGSPLADPENYLKFFPPEALNLGALFYSIKQLLFENNAFLFGRLFLGSLWFTGFYVACMILPLLAIVRTSKKIAIFAPKIMLSRLKARSLPSLVLALLLVVFLGLVVSISYNFLASRIPLKYLSLFVIGLYLNVFVLVMAIVFDSGDTASARTSLLYRCARISPLAVISMSFFFVSYVGLGSNWDIKSSDLSVSLLSLYIFWRAGRGIKSADAVSIGSRYFTLAAILSLLLSSVSAIARIRMIMAGIPAGVNNVECKLEASRFWGKNFWSSLDHCKLDEELRGIIKQLSLKDTEKVFFGPRMEAYYAATSRQNPSDMPIWWHPGTSFSSADKDLYVYRFKQSDFQLLIFMKDDFTRIPQEIIDHINSDAYVKLMCSHIDVYLSRRLALAQGVSSGHLPNCQIPK